MGSLFRVALPMPVRSVVADVDGSLVLVCDGDQAARRLMTDMLDDHGYRALAVATGEEALAQAVARQPAAILLDMVLPGMDGHQVAAALRRRPDTRDIPIIVLSLLAPTGGETNEAEVTHWLSKPLHVGALLRALGQAVQPRDEAAVAATSQPSAAPRMLLIEDDLDLAGVLTTMFRRHNVRTLHAQTGREAMELGRLVVPDLLVLDLMLPEVDGFGVVEWSRRQEHLRAVPLVVYTAKDLTEAERARLALGPTQIMTKGRIAPEEFERRVIRLLDHIVPDRRGRQA